MPPPSLHAERHYSNRAGWLRASVLGANDGIVSTACLIIAVAAAGATRHAVVLAGISALVAGAFSMAIGEYTSVSSQRDAEQADIAKERRELAETPERELRELTRIYIDKGLSQDLAHEVAVELSRGDVLAVHMAEELGLTHETLARPTQAAAIVGHRLLGGGADPAAGRAGLRLVDHRRGWWCRRWPPWSGWPRWARPVRPPGAPRSAGPRVRMLGLGAVAMAVVALIGHLVGVAAG